jgi:hypothetical protein
MIYSQLTERQALKVRQLFIENLARNEVRIVFTPAINDRLHNFFDEMNVTVPQLWEEEIKKQ